MFPTTSTIPVSATIPTTNLSQTISSTTVSQTTSFTTASQTTSSITASQTSSTINASQTISTTTKASVNESCFRPKIRLIPSGTSLSSPLQFRRSQDFYILSKIGLNCNDSLTTTTKWTINNCSLECSSPVQLDQTIITNFSELFIPARTFPYGLYELKLTVTMNASPN
ncbi:unnamed protein product [Rotaria sp. Silwood1]|nr:unnamed protein product [Rotaria sp. Silwood1]